MALEKCGNCNDILIYCLKGEAKMLTIICKSQRNATIEILERNYA